MNEKKKNNYFIKFISLILIAFTVIYVLNTSGYYENKLHTETVYTNEAINQFEEDIKNGKEIDINSYIKKDNKDYSNTLTKISDGIGSLTSELISNGTRNLGNVFKTLFG